MTPVAAFRSRQQQTLRLVERIRGWISQPPRLGLDDPSAGQADRQSVARVVLTKLVERMLASEQGEPARRSCRRGCDVDLSDFPFSAEEFHSPEDALTPAVLGAVVEGIDPQRKASGCYYTPPSLVDWMCRQSLKALLAARTRLSGEALSKLLDEGRAALLSTTQRRIVADELDRLRAVDPACGSGAFLIGLAEILFGLHRALQRSGDAATCSDRELRMRIVDRNLYGVDIDPLSVQAAAVRLSLWSRGRSAEEINWELPHLAVGDALLGPVKDGPTNEDGVRRFEGRPPDTATPVAWSLRFGEVFARQQAGFDLVVGNPPYVNMFAQRAGCSEYRDALKRNFATARGGFDLCVPFIERAVQLLAPGGAKALLVPNKIFSAAYAQRVRAYVTGHAELVAVADCTGGPRSSRFRAAVYPAVMVAVRRGPRPGQWVDVYSFGKNHSAAASDSPLTWTHRSPASLAEQTGLWSPLTSDEAHRLLPALESGLPLRDLADICAAATVDEAYRWKAAVIDQGRPLWQASPERYVRLIVSGNLRAEGPRWTDRPVRYLKRVYRQPVLDLEHRDVSARRREQIRAGKVIVSGMGRRPIAVWSPQPLAAGVATTLIFPRTQLDGQYLAAVLNSASMERIYRWLFGALALAGGYLRIGAPQLKMLPIPLPPMEEQRDIAALAKRRAGDKRDASDLQAEIDAKVGALFGLPKQAGASHR